MTATKEKQALRELKNFNLEPVPEHNTEDCFQPGRSFIRYTRDRDLDSMTPQQRIAHEGGVYKAHALKERVNNREIAMMLLGIQNDDVTNEELMHRLVQEKHTVEMRQIERQIERFENGIKDTVLVKNGRTKILWFVDNYDNSVSVVRVLWRPDWRHWVVRIVRFEHGQNSYYNYKCNPEDRVVSRNLDHS